MLREKLLSRKKPIIILAVIILVLLSLFIFYRLNSSSTQEEIQTAKVVKTDLKIAFSIDGNLTIDSYEPGFTVSGKVVKVNVKEGDMVTKGQLLASLDAREAQKNFEKAMRDYSIERNGFDESKFVTYADSVNTDTLTRILENNQWDLEKAVLDVELKNLAISQSNLYSPVDGMIAQINVKTGSSVSTQNQTPAMVIVNPDSLSFVAYAEEDDVLKIKDGQTAQITLDSYDETFPAELTFVSPLSTEDSNGISSYKVTANIENPNEKRLIDGMEGSIYFVTKEVKNVTVVPNKAIYREGNQSFVSVIDSDGNIEKVQVETGFTDGKSVEVKKGLKVGQEVVLLN